MGFSEKPSKMVGDPPRGLHGNSFWNAIRMGNREKQTFGKNFLSEERNAKDHIPNQQHGIYQAYIYIYICGNLPRRKRIFFGAANTGILFCFTSPIWGQVIGYPTPSRYPSHSEVEVLANWVLNRVLSGLFTNNAGMKHGITIGSQLRNSISCRYRAPPLQTRCTRGTCASFGWREHLRTNLPMAWHRAEWAPSHSRFGSVWCEKRCFDGQIIYDCLPYSMEVFLKTTVQNRICKNYSWFEFKPCQSHGSPSWADDICHLWQTHIWHLSDTS